MNKEDCEELIAEHNAKIQEAMMKFLSTLSEFEHVFSFDGDAIRIEDLKKAIKQLREDLK